MGNGEQGTGKEAAERERDRKAIGELDLTNFINIAHAKIYLPFQLSDRYNLNRQALLVNPHIL